MKLRTEPSKLQTAMYVTLFFMIFVLSQYLHEYFEAEEDLAAFMAASIIIAAVIVAVAILGGRFIQFVFGIPQFGTDSDKPCATAFYWSDQYCPSSARVDKAIYSRDYSVKLNLILSMEDLKFIDDNNRRSGLNYFKIFKGYFPFAENGKTFYLTRSAMRRVRRFIKRADRMETRCGYARLEFKFKVPYFGREIPGHETYYLLSKWDLAEIKKHSLASATSILIDDLLLTQSDLERYQNELKNSKLDTFIKVVSQQKTDEMGGKKNE